MRIPFGEIAPDFEETAILAKLGFNVSNIQQQGKYYFLELPENPRITVDKKNPDFDRSYTRISLNGIEVISINQKTASYDSWVMFNINKDRLEEALAKNAEVVIPNSASALTEFQVRLKDRLRQLESIIFEDGAQRGYGKLIGAQLTELKQLQQENPQEHDELISSNAQYQKLVEMFPSWTDSKNLQPKYEAQDVGAFSTLLAASEDGSKCCIS